MTGPRPPTARVHPLPDGGRATPLPGSPGRPGSPRNGTGGGQTLDGNVSTHRWGDCCRGPGRPWPREGLTRKRARSPYGDRARFRV